MGTATADQPAGASSDKLRHVESMSELPSGAGKISGINAVVLGESLADEEHDLVFPSPDFSADALVSSPTQYLEMYERSINDPAGFWSEIAETFYWKEKWSPSEVCSENLDVTKGPVQITWFKGGKTNICYNAVDRNVEAGNGDKIAMYWEGNEPGQDGKLTYSELLDKVCQSAMKRENTKWQAGRDVWWQDVVTNFPTKCDVEWVDAEDPLFLLYTSGSTGKPKGVLHTSGGYMVYTATTFKYAFDYKPTDIYWCTADCGWITGHSYVTYGPLLNGAAVLVFEGAPNYPDSGRCWDIVDKYKVTIFYTAPTLVRSLMRDGPEYVTRYSRKSLRVLGSVGEPINPSAWRWFYNVVGDSQCPISDTWWQTETGGFMMTPLPGAWPQKPGSATFPFFGVQPVIVDEKGQEIEGECSGYLCIKKSWPGAFRTLYGDHDRYETTYFKPFAGYYFTGDGCSRDKDGYHWLTGRVDDVINVSGHRIGTAEVESALVSHPQCAEAAVVGVEHEVKGQGIYAFVTLVDGVPYSEELRKSLIAKVRNQVYP
jgi:acyl-coenzyme A synthetase/AMP-(fatty) acid ligase